MHIRSTLLLLPLTLCSLACGRESASAKDAAPPPPAVVVATVAQHDQSVYREWKC